MESQLNESLQDVETCDLDMMEDTSVEEFLATQHYISPFKRKTNPACEETQEVYEVLRRIKKIKFPLCLNIKTLNGKLIEVDIDSNRYHL